jgi:O-antigen ligase
MIKKLFSCLVFIPFLFPIIYKVKFSLRNLGSFNLLDLSLLLIILLGTFLIFKENLKLEFKKYFLENPFLKKIILFLFFVLLVSLLNFKNLTLRDLGILKSYFILPVLAGAILIFYLKKKWFKFQDFFYGYLLYTVFLSIIAIVFRFLNLTTFDDRVKLFFESPNQLAIALSLGIISTFVLETKNNKKNYLYLILLIPALLLTKSTGAFLAIFFVSIIFSTKKLFSLKKIFLKIILIFSCFFLLSFFLLPFIAKELHYNPYKNQNSFDSRMVIYSITSKIVSENFWTGIGPANFQKKYLSEQKNSPPYPQWAVPHSHNLFSQILLSFGFGGLFLFFFLLNKKPSFKSRVFYLFLFYFLIHGLADVSIWNNDQAFFFWFIMFF